MNAIAGSFSSILARSWWLILLRGLAAITFGVLAWFQPGLTLAALVLLFGAYALADGILAVWTAVSGRAVHEDWWVLLLIGLLGVGIGLLAFILPGLTALAIVFYIAIWAVATGVLEIVAAIRLRREIKNEWWLILAGLISVVFGAVLMASPGAGALTLLWLIASFAFVYGVFLVMLAIKSRRFGHKAL